MLGCADSQRLVQDAQVPTFDTELHLYPVLVSNLFFIELMTISTQTRGKLLFILHDFKIKQVYQHLQTVIGFSFFLLLFET